MQTEDITMLDKDPQVFGNGLNMQSKGMMALVAFLPSVIVWATIWRLKDAMICGWILLIYYFAICCLHRKYIGSGLWKHAIRRDLSGNLSTRLLYNVNFAIVSSVVIFVCLFLYCAYIDWGPQQFSLPAPRIDHKYDAVYWIWSIFLYVLLIPIAEISFWFIFQTYNWPIASGRIVVGICYGTMNAAWIIPLIENTVWNIIFIVFFAGFGWFMHRLTITQGLIRMYGIRLALSLTLTLLIFFVSILNQPASPNILYLGHQENYFQPPNITIEREMSAT